MGRKDAFEVGRIRGIPIRIHVTFLLVLPFLAYAFGERFVEAARLAGTPPGQLVGSPWLWGLAVALALFGSVLVHELAHSLYALRNGGKVRSITLLMIGGVSELSAPPRGEVAMALAGPAASLVIGATFVGVARLVDGSSLPNVRFALFYLGQLNLILGMFNLLPAFPMDGGRILRGALARRIGAVRATRFAARIGRAFAVLFATLGFLSLNVMLLFIAFVVWVGAETEARDVLVRSALGHLKVSDLMTPLETGVTADQTLLEVGARMVRERRTSYPVIDGGRVVGSVTAAAVTRVAPDHRGRTRAGEVVGPAAVVQAGEQVADALHLLGRAVPELVVLEGDRLVGTISQLDIVRGLDLHELVTAGAGGPNG